MIPIKTEEEIEIIKKAGKKLAKVKEILKTNIKAGVTLLELDQIAQREIRKLGGEPAFQKVPKYKWATCINVNEGLVHGIPTKRALQPGDKVSVDVGIWYRGMNTDSAFTMGVKPVPQEVARFIAIGRETLGAAINQVRPGSRIGHISKMIHEGLTKAGYSPSRAFAGHGVGRQLHEEPVIHCFFENYLSDTPLIKPGMVFAIEVIYCQGGPDFEIANDGWTAFLKDGKIGGLFEETVIVTEDEPIVATRQG